MSTTASRRATGRAAGGVAPNPVRAALADGISGQRIAVAAHEIGHAIAWQAAGMRPSPILVRTGLFGGVSGGFCHHNARGRLTDANVAAFLTGYPAGTVAQLRCCRLYLHQRHTHTGDGTDRREFAYVNRPHVLGWDAAARRAARLLDRHAARLDALTAQLARAGRLNHL